MACSKCGGRRIEGSRATLKRSYEIPEASTPYEGPQSNAAIYVVGLGTENEQAFSRADRDRAISLARENEWTIDVLPAKSLERELVEGVLGGDLAQPSVDA
jgi:hypothetical protein